MPYLKVLNEKTLVPISLVIFIIGGVLWLSTVWAEVRANSNAVRDIKSDQKSWTRYVRSVDTRLSRIEGALNIKTQED